MKTSLSLNLRRVRSSVRTDVNTGAVTVPCTIITCGTTCGATNKVPESRLQGGSAAKGAYGVSGG